MSVFDENYIEKNLISEEESCPICGAIGCLMDMEEKTENYKKFRDIITNSISVTDLVNFDECSDDDTFHILVHNIVKVIKTDKKCPHCNKTLYLSDLPEYEYVCIECDENFYEIEVK
jgi:ribosomal protein S27AE